MTEYVRMRLEGGGTLLFEVGAGLPDPPLPLPPAPPGATAPPPPPPRPPKPAVDIIRDVPPGLQSALAPVGTAARIVLEQLRKAEPSEVEIEFGVDLSSPTATIITKTETPCHFKVRMCWAPDPDADPDAEQKPRPLQFLPTGGGSPAPTP
ncbi:CU044_2847 family protein [Yinghuangia soli]|uniref:Trypsin-co-occurring domain-containing protein n=1 Tax=Yinghuangia soli TaxID=2908204 RepID=A0AA41PY71_9ACTN|nr:CU044_2847 family protein [Yinghuangia soli]MCF2527861.1 hypothetical protein [Yinghuangia soli]